MAAARMLMPHCAAERPRTSARPHRTGYDRCVRAVPHLS
eukprot:SAG31_NODE_21859_length_539_cov_0.790909_1_plen_38_part_01